MLFCCRKSCCSKAAGDKGALQGAGFSTLQAPVVGRQLSPWCAVAAASWDHEIGQSGSWDMTAELGGSTSLDGKQSLPDDAKGRPSWCGFCAGVASVPPGIRGCPHLRERACLCSGGKPKRLGEIIHTAMHEWLRSSPVAEKMPGPLAERVVRCSTGTPARLGEPCHAQGVQLQVPWPRCPGCPGQARV